MLTNQATTADFAFSAVDTKLGCFDGRFLSGIPLLGGLYFAFRPFCETLYLIAARGGNAHQYTRDSFRDHVRASTADAVKHDGHEMWRTVMRKAIVGIGWAANSSDWIANFTFLGG
jgi:hypothetical protein